MTQEEALTILRDQKGMYSSKGERFLWARLGSPLRLPTYSGGTSRAKSKMLPTGTLVLVTMLSRFGDVGIRAHDLFGSGHGYDARVLPEDLTDWRLQGT